MANLCAHMTEEPKTNKETLPLLLSHTQEMWLNCKVIKKVTTPYFYIKLPPSFSGLASFFSKKLVPAKWISFWKVLHPFFNRGGGEGGSNYALNIFPSIIAVNERGYVGIGGIGLWFSL